MAIFLLIPIQPCSLGASILSRAGGLPAPRPGRCTHLALLAAINANQYLLQVPRAAYFYKKYLTMSNPLAVLFLWKQHHIPEMT